MLNMYRKECLNTKYNCKNNIYNVVLENATARIYSGRLE